MEKLFTKSRMRIALDCPAKLYYSQMPEYVNQSIDDPFLRSLADGGFQVGALAKCYYPEGIEITEKDYEISVKKTDDLLKKDNVVIFEAAFRYKDLFVRTDVLVKKGNMIKLMEVKAKVYDPDDNTKTFFNIKENFIRKDWIPYLYDIAFQKYVVMKSFEEKKPVLDPKVEAYLTLADKRKSASVDGLNQKFLIMRDDSKEPRVILTGDVTPEALGEKILTDFPVDDLIEKIYHSKEGIEFLGAHYEEYINRTSEYFMSKRKINTDLGNKCKSCEYHTQNEDAEHKSGFKECWREKAGFKEDDFNKPLVYDVWFFEDKMSKEKFRNGIYFADELKSEDFGISGSIVDQTLKRKDRQWVQVQKYINNDDSLYLYEKGLAEKIDSCTPPYHFIDFETAAAALPFNKGLRPYEGIAFQFSHHVVNKDGTIEHKGQYINYKKGFFPNFEFVRELKNQLDKDNGSIFRYASHENTYLRLIRDQLDKSDIGENPDKKELCEWIDTITEYKVKNVKTEGCRNMMDLKNMVLSYYYNPATNGSNSIKQVLPSVLNASVFLKNKYSKPIYGSANGIKSLNYKDWTWIKYDSLGNVIDPYMILASASSNEIAGNINSDIGERLTEEETIHEGGAAMTAYAKMQFSEMSEEERAEKRAELLRYCELDTFAMIMIWEYWNDILKK